MANEMKRLNNDELEAVSGGFDNNNNNNEDIPWLKYCKLPVWHDGIKKCDDCGGTITETYVHVWRSVRSGSKDYPVKICGNCGKTWRTT